MAGGMEIDPFLDYFGELSFALTRAGVFLCPYGWAFVEKWLLTQRDRPSGMEILKQDTSDRENSPVWGFASALTK